MREYKFRAKPLENDSIDKHITVIGKDWIYGSSDIELPNGRRAIIHLDEEGRLTVTMIADASCFMFTGLKTVDDNVEVYEGDILRHRTMKGPNGKPVLHLVRCIVDSLHGTSSFNLPSPFHKFEVIGNIYENPELLKGNPLDKLMPIDDDDAREMIQGPDW